MADERTFVPGELADDTCVGLVYLVRRRRVFCYLRTDWSGSVRLPVDPNIRIFRTRDEAYAYCSGLCNGHVPSPPDANPFLYCREGFDGGEECYPFFDDPALGTSEENYAVFVQSLGYELPEKREITTRRGATYTGYDWGAWWDRYAPGMTDERRGELWRKFGGLYYYDVVELSLDVPPGDPLRAAFGRPE